MLKVLKGRSLNWFVPVQLRLHNRSPSQRRNQECIVKFGKTFPWNGTYLWWYSADGGFLVTCIVLKTNIATTPPESVISDRLHPATQSFLSHSCLSLSPRPPGANTNLEKVPIHGRKLIIQDERKRTEESVCQWWKKKKNKRKKCKLEDKEK